MGEHVDVWPGTLVVGVPFVFFYQERVGHVFHHGVTLVLHVDRGIGEGADIVFPAHAAHEVAEPLPHIASPENVAKERGVMKAYEVALPLVYVSLEIASRVFAPCVRRAVGRIVEHQYDVELLEEVFVNLAEISHPRGLGVHFLFVLVEPRLGRVAEALVRSALLGYAQYAFAWRGGFESHAGKEAEKHEKQYVPFHLRCIYKVSHVIWSLRHPSLSRLRPRGLSTSGSVSSGPRHW